MEEKSQKSELMNCESQESGSSIDLHFIRNQKALTGNKYKNVKIIMEFQDWTMELTKEKREEEHIDDYLSGIKYYKITHFRSNFLF